MRRGSKSKKGKITIALTNEEAIRFMQRKKYKKEHGSSPSELSKFQKLMNFNIQQDFDQLDRHLVDLKHFTRLRNKSKDNDRKNKVKFDLKVVRILC